RRSRIAADDVVGRHEVEGRRHVDLRALLVEARREPERRLIVEPGRPIVQTRECRLVRRLRPVHRIAADFAVRETQGERRVRIRGSAVDGESRLADLLTGGGRDARDLTLEGLLLLAHDRIERAAEHDERIHRPSDRVLTAVDELLANGRIGELRAADERSRGVLGRLSGERGLYPRMIWTELV